MAIALIAGRNQWKRLLISILVGYIIQTSLTEVVKVSMGRPRPSQIQDPDLFFGPGTEYHSLPSGHASFMFMFATICACWFPRARLPIYGLAGFVAASRIVVGAHYPSDVIIGALLGVLSAWVILSIWRPPVKRRAKKSGTKGSASSVNTPEAAPRKPEHGWKSLRMRPVDDGK